MKQLWKPPKVAYLRDVLQNFVICANLKGPLKDKPGKYPLKAKLQYHKPMTPIHFHFVCLWYEYVRS